MLKKILLALFFTPFITLCQPMLIKNFIDNPVGKVIVIDSSIVDITKARKEIDLFFNNGKTEIITLDTYRNKIENYKEHQTIFWGLLVRDGLIWNSLAGERAQTIKQKFAYIPDDLSVITYGKNPFTQNRVLLFSSKKENNMTFNRDIVDDSKSVNAFLKGKLIETAVMNENFKVSEFKNSAVDELKEGALKPDKTIKDGNITVHNYKLADITIISVPDTLNFIFVPKDVKIFEAIAAENNFRYMINGTYFAGTYKEASHCGRLKIYEKMIIPDVMEDKQLKYILSYNRKSGAIKYAYYKNFISDNDENSLEFQTGPLVIENSKLADTAIKSSINWGRNAKRTLIASLDNKDKFLIIVRESVKLDELGKLLLKMSVFNNRRLDVMNLDGGSSTALYSKNFPKLNYRPTSQLPLLIGIK